MNDEPQPDVRWAPLQPKPKNRWRPWLVAGLGLLAVAIVAVFLTVVLPEGFKPEPTATPSATASSSPSPSSTPSASDTPDPEPIATSTPAPTSDPEQTPPAVPDPDLDAFAEQMRPWLDDGMTGLQIAHESGGQEATTVVESLRQDAERMSDSAAPRAIADQWSRDVTAYLNTLNTLNQAYSTGDGVTEAEREAASALQTLRGLVDL